MGCALTRTNASKRLMPGSLVLGQISQINRYDIALTLPNNLTGYISLISISDTLSDKVSALAAVEASEDGVDGEELSDIDLNSFFVLGQYLRAYVTSTNSTSKPGEKGKKHIELSVNPLKANTGLDKLHIVPSTMVQATVQSVEDHGLIMNVGLEDASIRGFMSSKEVGRNVDHQTVKEGSVYLCIVTGLSPNGKIIKLSADPERIGSIKKTNYLTNAPTVDSLLPGTAVELLISEITSSGIAGKVMGLVDTTADIIHSGNAASGKPLDKKYSIGGKVKGRVICTFPTSNEKKLGISLLDHIISMTRQTSQSSEHSKTPTEIIPLSTIIEEVKVAKVEPGLGLFVDIGMKGVRGFVHISRISDKKIELLSESLGIYKLGSVHPGRVVGYNSVDGLFIVSLEKSIIDLPFLRLEDVQIGQTVTGTIDKLMITEAGVSGMVVKITDNITGLVPEMHFADIHLQYPERKFKEGMSVTARVLSTNLDKRQMRLTLKKTLVNSDAPIWISYDDIRADMKAPGTIVKILPSGAVVQFYGPIRGFLPVSEMSETYIQDPMQHFRTGQVLNIQVLSVDCKERKLTVSCRDHSAFGLAQQKALKDLSPGTLVSGTVSEKTSDEIVIELADTRLKGGLPFEHLTDGSLQKNASAAKNIRVGQMLQDLVVLNANENKRLIKLTKKPSLVKASQSGTLLKSFNGLVTGVEVAGFVDNITSKGVFVRFAGSLTGLLLKKYLQNEVTKLPDFGFRRNQSISAKIVSVDYEQQRFLLSQMGETIKEASNSRNKSGFLPSESDLSNPADGVSTSVDDYTPGKLTKARITAIKRNQLNVQLADNVQGRIHVSEVFDTLDEIKDWKQPLKSFRVSQIVPVRIIGIYHSRNHRFLPITHREGAPVFELSAKPSVLTEEELKILTIDKIELGSTWLVSVHSLIEGHFWVNLSPNVRGRIRAMDMSKDLSLLSDLNGNFPVGSILRAQVMNVDASKNRLRLSAKSESSSVQLNLADLSKDMVLHGRVTKISERSIMVQLSEELSAPVYLIDLSDDYSTANPTVYQKDQIIRVCVREADQSSKRIVLSTRPSKVLSSSSLVKDQEIASISQLKVNDIVRGFVKNITDIGVFLNVGSYVTAFVRVTDLSDSYLKEWKDEFQVDQLVEGKVIQVDPILNHVQMSLKRSVIDKNYKAPITYSDVSVGQVVTGKVRKVEDFGVFVVIDDSANVSGLCHRSEMAETRVADVKNLYNEGDIVKAKVLKVDLEKRRISFGLKASYFAELDEHIQGSNKEDSDGDSMEGVEVPEGTESGSDNGDEDVSRDFGNVQDFDSDNENSTGADMNAEQSVARDGSPLPGLSTGGFDWTGGIFNQDNKDAQSDTDGETLPPKKKKRRRAEIKVDRTGEMDVNGPQSVADFERFLMGEPNSSFLWLSYMAFQLQLSEVGKAREIAERAIKTINHTGDGDSEALNVWVAFLNLENTYGSDETVEEIFRRACEYNDAEEIHNRLTSIYIQSGKNEKADDLLQTMVKKFSQDPKVWLNYATFLFNTLATPPRARALLPRAMQSLPKYHHVDLTSKFAQLEFRSPNGDAERGRTIFEGLVGTFPKRTDLWKVLLDLEVQQGDKEQVRRLLGRVTSSKLKPRKAKYFFKRWLEFEEKEGGAKSCEMVKAKAAEYVRQHGSEKEQD